MLAKTFGVDVSKCPECGADMQIVAMINDQIQIARYLKHIGLTHHPPPIAETRHQQGEFAYEDTHPEDDVQIHPDYDHYI